MVEVETNSRAPNHKHTCIYCGHTMNEKFMQFTDNMGWECASLQACQRRLELNMKFAERQPIQAKNMPAG